MFVKTQYPELVFIAGFYRFDAASKKAVFYLMNTSRNRNRWGVTQKALDETLPSPSAYPELCFGWVEWSGGSVVQANFDCKKAVDEFFIVIITKNADADQAESDGLPLAEKAEALFSADRKLGSAVTDSLVTLRDKQKVFDGKFSVNAVRLTLQTWRWIPQS